MGIRRNAKQGKDGESFGDYKAGLEGYEIEKKHVGEDRVLRKYDPITGEITREVHKEYKTGNANQSKIQKKKQHDVEENGGEYDVERFSGDI